MHIIPAMWWQSSMSRDPLGLQVHLWGWKLKLSELSPGYLSHIGHCPRGPFASHTTQNTEVIGMYEWLGEAGSTEEGSDSTNYSLSSIRMLSHEFLGMPPLWIFPSWPISAPKYSTCLTSPFSRPAPWAHNGKCKKLIQIKKKRKKKLTQIDRTTLEDWKNANKLEHLGHHPRENRRLSTKPAFAGSGEDIQTYI